MSKMGELEREQSSLIEESSDCDGPYLLPGEHPTNVTNMVAAQFKRALVQRLPNYVKTSMEVMDDGKHRVRVTIGEKFGQSMITDYSDAGVDKILNSMAPILAVFEAEHKKARKVSGSDIEQTTRSVLGDRGWFSH